MKREFEVEVVHRQRAVYRVCAPDRKAAEQQASERWRRGEPSDVPGYEWSELVSCTAHPAPDPERVRQDVELVYRFLTERERLIQQIGGDPFNPSANDAISAAQVAADLGWLRPEDSGGVTADDARATEALEQLCTARRAVCFARQRMRNRERGEIRLYCTPEYLEQLSSDHEVIEPQVV
ncbi:MAG TPA: hypothetical protein VF167_01130 [Longimicrobiaceae bacterium]